MRFSCCPDSGTAACSTAPLRTQRITVIHGREQRFLVSDVRIPGARSELTLMLVPI